LVLNVNQVLQIDATVVTGVLILLTISGFSQLSTQGVPILLSDDIGPFHYDAYLVRSQGLPLGNTFIAAAIIPFAYSAFSLITVSLKIQKKQWRTFFSEEFAKEKSEQKGAEKRVEEEIERKLRISLIRGLRLTSYGFVYLILAVVYFIIIQPITGELILRA